jgi:hypothetical protein
LVQRLNGQADLLSIRPGGARPQPRQKMINMERLQTMANELAVRQKELAGQLDDNHTQLLEIAEGVRNCVEAQQTAAAG